MKTKFKQFISGLLVASLVLPISFLVSCARNPQKELLPPLPDAVDDAAVTWLFPDFFVTDEAAFSSVIEAINEKLRKDGMNITLDVRVADANEFAAIVYDFDSAASGQSAYDFCIVNQQGYRAFLEHDATADLHEAINEYAALSSEFARDEGALFALDMSQHSNGRQVNEIIVKTAAYNAYVEEHGTLDDVHDLIAYIKAQPESEQKLLTAIEPSPGFLNVALPPYALHRTYDEWPFKVSPDFLFLYGIDGSVSSYIESDICKQDIENVALLSSYIFTEAQTRQADIYNLFKMSVALFPAGYQNFAQYIQSGRDDLQLVQMKPNAAQINTNSSSMYLILQKNSPRVETTLRFLEWAYSDIENYLLLTHGIEGTHYELEDSVMMVEKKPADKALYDISELFSSSLHDDVFKIQSTDEIARAIPLDDFTSFEGADFTFDQTDCLETYTAVIAAYHNAGTHENAIAAMKQAGLDSLLDECRLQYERYLGILSARN